jgi:hypothetical protein
MNSNNSPQSCGKPNKGSIAMKLTLSHNDIVAGVCAFLGSKGLTGFDPSQVHAEFTKTREGTLTCTLDDELPVGAVAKEKAPKAKVVPTTDVGASGDQLSKADDLNAKAAEVPAGGAVSTSQAQSEAEVVKEAPATEAEAKANESKPAETATAEVATAAAGEENLFG